MLFPTLSTVASLLACANAAAVPWTGTLQAKPIVLERLFETSVDLVLTDRHTVPIPGGSKLGIPIGNNTRVWGPVFNATLTGYSWTSTVNAGTPAERTNIDVFLRGTTHDGVPFNIIEIGVGKKSASAYRRIIFEIGAPYQWLESEFLLAQVVTPAPNLTVATYKVVQN